MFSHRRASSDGDMQNFKVGDVVTGVVQSVKVYGAFLDIGGAMGLLHISQITHERLTTVEQVLQVSQQGQGMLQGPQRVPRAACSRAAAGHDYIMQPVMTVSCSGFWVSHAVCVDIGSIRAQCQAGDGCSDCKRAERC